MFAETIFPFNFFVDGRDSSKALDLDVARAMLLFSALMYERKTRWVEFAARYPAWTETLLLKSEENMHAVTSAWGIKFVSVGEMTEVRPPPRSSCIDERRH